MLDWLQTADGLWYCWLALTGLWLIGQSICFSFDGGKKHHPSVDIFQIFIEYLGQMLFLGWLIYAVFKLFVE